LRGRLFEGTRILFWCGLRVVRANCRALGIGFRGLDMLQLVGPDGVFFFRRCRLVSNHRYCAVDYSLAFDRQAQSFHVAAHDDPQA